MCEPASITAATVAIVGAAVSTGIQMNAAKKADDRAGAATTAELQRQKAMKEQGDVIVRRNVQAQGADGTQAAMQMAASNRSGAYDKAAADAYAYAPGGANSEVGGAGPQAVTDAYKGELGDSQKYLHQQGQAHAAMQSFGDAQLGNALQNAQTGYQLQNLLSNKNGSMEASMAELNAAGHSADGQKMLGQAVGALGSAAGSYAGSYGGGAKAGGSGAKVGTGGGGGGKY